LVISQANKVEEQAQKNAVAGRYSYLQFFFGKDRMAARYIQKVIYRPIID